MKATGMLRRIDELGRIVIPKEIRKNLRIYEGDNIEIYTEGENIVLKKYSLVKNIRDFAQQFADSIYGMLKYNIIVTDQDHIVAVAGPMKKEYNQKEMSEELLSYIQRRNNLVENHVKPLAIIPDKIEEGTYIIQTISVLGDIVGLIVFFTKEEQISDVDAKIAKIAADFFAKYLEE